MSDLSHSQGADLSRRAASGAGTDPRAKAEALVTARHWDMNVDIPWQDFQSDKIDPELLKIIKAASMVEYNARDYAIYLCNVFHDDLAFKDEARAWAKEEVQHGAALGKWAMLADPSFDHEARFRRFVAGFRPNIDASQSIRGGRARELVTRCMIEVGTSSYYGSIGQATEEPVLKEICKRIAGDELRHYKMFYRNMKRYLEIERPTRPQRLKTAIGRVLETEDDELSYAYYAANAPLDAPYDRREANRAYMRRAFTYYRPQYVERAVAMTWKAAGYDPQTRIALTSGKIAWWMMQRRARRLIAKGV